jgi:hypothetical protein
VYEPNPALLFLFTFLITFSVLFPLLAASSG